MSRTSGLTASIQSSLKGVTAGGTLFWMLMIGIVIGAFLFFVPGVSVFSSKSFIIISTTLIALLALITHEFRKGVMSVPRDTVIYSFLFLGFIILLSALFSGAPRLAFFGNLGDSTSALALITLIALFFLGHRVFRNTNRAMLYVTGIFTSAILVLTYHLIRFFAGPDTLVWGSFDHVFASPAGTWLDVGIIFSLALVCITLVLEFRLFRPIVRACIALPGVLFILFLFSMNIRNLWVGLGFISLLLVLYIASIAFWHPDRKSFGPGRRLPLFTLILFIVSLIGLFFGPSLHTTFARFGATESYTSIHSTIPGTFRAGLFSTRKNPFVGVSPAQFRYAFVNGNTFSAPSLEIIDQVTLGYGWLPTILATTGILGILAVLWVLFACIREVWRMTGSGFRNPESRFLVILFLSLGTTVGIFSLITTPSFPMLAIGALSLGGWYRFWTLPNPPKDLLTLPFLKNPRTSFFGVIILLVWSGIILGGLYAVIRMYGSELALARSLHHDRAGNRTEAIRSLNRALTLWQSQKLLQFGAVSALEEIQNIGIGNQKKQASVFKNEIEELSARALALTEAFRKQNPRDDRTWRFVGDFYRMFGSLGIQGGYLKALEAYDMAHVQSPNDERIQISRARAFLANGSPADARAIITASLMKTPTVDGLRMRAEFAVQDGDMAAAKDALRTALSIRPSDPSLYRDLGALYYRSRDYQSAELVLATGFRTTPALDILALLTLTLERQGNWLEAENAKRILGRYTENVEAVLGTLRSNLTILTPEPPLEEIIQENSGDRGVQQ